MLHSLMNKGLSRLDGARAPFHLRQGFYRALNTLQSISGAARLEFIIKTVDGRKRRTLQT